MLFNFNHNLKKAMSDLYSNSFSFSMHEDLTDLGFPKKEDPNFEYSEEKAETETSVTTKETWKSTNGSVCFSRVTSTPKKKEVTADEIKENIKKAVKAEDYETAAALKKELEKMKRKD